jgi:hypothetical protein
MSGPETRTMPISRGKLQTLGSGSRAMCKSKLAAEDRCHLNGLALDGGQPRYVTVVRAPVMS